MIQLSLLKAASLPPQCTVPFLPPLAVHFLTTPCTLSSNFLAPSFKSQIHPLFKSPVYRLASSSLLVSSVLSSNLLAMLTPHPLPFTPKEEASSRTANTMYSRSRNMDSTETLKSLLKLLPKFPLLSVSLSSPSGYPTLGPLSTGPLLSLQVNDPFIGLPGIRQFSP